MGTITKFRGFKPKTKQEFLAQDLAESLNDYPALPLYIYYSQKYPEAVLRQILSKVLDIPDGKIKKSRGALFNYLVQKYGKQATKNHRS